MATRKVHRVKRTTVAAGGGQKRREECVHQELDRVKAELAKIKKDEPEIRQVLKIMDNELDELNKAMKKLQVGGDDAAGGEGSGAGASVDVGGGNGKEKAKLRGIIRGKQRLRNKTAEKLADILELEARVDSLEQKKKVSAAMGIPVC